MQKIFVSLIAACLFYSATAKPHNADANNVHIYGNVIGFAKYIDSANSVRFFVNDMMTGHQASYNAKLKSDGSFAIDIPKIYAQGIFFEYDTSMVSIIIFPGKPLKITFNADSPSVSLRFGGDCAQVNTDLQAYLAEVDKQNMARFGKDHFERYRQLAKSEKQDGPEKHKQYLLKQYYRESSMLSQYIASHKLTQTFITWATMDLKYECADNLMRYTWMHPRFAKGKPAEFDPGEGYYDFFNQFEISDPAATISSNYGDYLGEYGRYIIKKELGNKYETGATLKLFRKQPALVCNLLICHQLYDLIEAKDFDVFDLIKKDYLSSLTNAKCKSSILRMYKTELDIRKNAKIPHDAHFGKVSSGDSLFHNIVAQYPNKVIYIDFWATWCGPCRAEMPKSKELQDKLKDNDVVFVYLCIQSKEQTWKQSIAEMGLGGHHFLLKNNDSNTLAGKFQFSGIPHYVLVNRQGNVFDPNAKRPGDEKLKADIEGLLAEK